MTLTEAINSYKTFQEARGDSETHRHESARILKVMLQANGDVPIAAITTEMLNEFILDIRRRPGLRGRERVSAHTVFAYHTVVNAFFNYLARNEFIRRNPMGGVPKPRIPRHVIRPLSPEQIQKLLAAPDTTTFTGLRDVTLMCFLLDTGCRISECLALTYDDINLDERSARVLGKGRRERLVPFGRRTVDWLTAYLERRRTHPLTSFVFVSQNGTPLRRESVARRMARYGRLAGIRGVRVSPHTFRHTFGVQWLLGDGQRSGDTLSLQRILGHSSPKMTDQYVYLAGGDLRRLHDRLSPADRLINSLLPSRPERLR